MKTSYRLTCVSVLIAGFCLAVSVLPARAEDVIISQFNDAGGLSGWRFDYGGVSHTIEFDATLDAANSATSGSMKVTMGFDAVALAGNNKGAITIDLPLPLDASAFLTMERDVRIDPGSPTDGSGNSGFFKMVVRNGPNYDFNPQLGAPPPANDGWRHFKVMPLAGV